MKPITSPKSASEILDMVYLDLRNHLLEVAAAFDRIERAGGTDDPRLDALRQAATTAVGPGQERTRQILKNLSAH